MACLGGPGRWTCRELARFNLGAILSTGCTLRKGSIARVLKRTSSARRGLSDHFLDAVDTAKRGVYMNVLHKLRGSNAPNIVLAVKYELLL